MWAFIKIDDEENQTLIDILLKNNETILVNPSEEEICKTNHEKSHNIIRDKIGKGNKYKFETYEILFACVLKTN